METYDFEALKKKAKENKKVFEQALKKAAKQKVIQQLPEIHQEVFSKIDCLSCANCCKHHSPRFNRTDIKRISKYLNMKEGELITTYLQIDEDEDYVVQSLPCPFLGADNKCTIYEVRPKDCRRFPYTDEDVLIKQAQLTIKNSAICPAVYASLEKIKEITDSHK